MTNTNKTWREKFREKFSVTEESPEYDGAEIQTLIMMNQDGDHWDSESIESFIDSLLSDLRNDIEENKNKIFIHGPDTRDLYESLDRAKSLGEEIGYNQAIDDILSHPIWRKE